MSGDKHRVSVVMCTYNGEKYVRAQLDSILAQTYPIWEIIIQDDNSNDGTWSILEQYASKHPNVHIFRNKQNLGVNGNFFSAVRRAKGNFIALSDQDDIWHADKIEKQMECIGERLLCSCHSRPFSDNGGYAYYDKRTPNYHLQRLIFDCLPGHSLLFRRSLLTDIMPEDNELYHVSFYDVAFDLAAGAFDSIAYTNEVLVDFRRHDDATTYTDKDYNKHNSPSVGNALYMLRWCISNYKHVRPKARRFWHARLAFLKAIDADTESCRSTIRMLELDLQDGLLPTIKLQWLFVKNYKILFHTTGGGIVRLIRAFLFPLLQYYYYR